MNEVSKCQACGSTLAANGECPDCNAPTEEPDWLDDCGYDKEPRPSATPPAPVADRPSGAVDEATCRVLPFPESKPVRLTPEELYAQGADHHHALTPARVAELESIIETVSKKLDPNGPPPRKLSEILRKAATNGTNHE